mgnify:CR=1 FL=1
MLFRSQLASEANESIKQRTDVIQSEANEKLVEQHNAELEMQRRAEAHVQALCEQAQAALSRRDEELRNAKIEIQGLREKVAHTAQLLSMADDKNKDAESWSNNNKILARKVQESEERIGTLESVVFANTAKLKATEQECRSEESERRNSENKSFGERSFANSKNQ